MISRPLMQANVTHFLIVFLVQKKNLANGQVFFSARIFRSIDSNDYCDRGTDTFNVQSNIYAAEKPQANNETKQEQHISGLSESLQLWK